MLTSSNQNKGIRVTYRTPPTKDIVKSQTIALIGPRGASYRYIFNRRPTEHCCGQIWHGVVEQEDTYSYVISTGARKLKLTTL